MADDADCQSFLDTLAKAVARRGWLCRAFCLMTNHFHLLVETPSPDLAVGMQFLNSAFAQTFNYRHGLRGHLFQGRYHAVLVEKESHLLEAARYVVLNPVRGGLCRTPEEWPWSSYRATAGTEKAPPFLAEDMVLAPFGTDPVTARKRYREFVAQAFRV